MNPKGLFEILPEAQEGKSSARNPWMVIVSVTLAVLFLYFALRNLDWQAFFNTLKNAQYVSLLLVLIWRSVSYPIRVLHLRVLLTSEKTLPLSIVFWANMAGYLGNNFSVSYALAVGLVERLMDLIALIVLGSFALSSTGIVSTAFQNALKGVSFLGLIGLIAIFVLPHFGELICRLIMSFPTLIERSAQDQTGSFFFSNSLAD